MATQANRQSAGAAQEVRLPVVLMVDDEPVNLEVLAGMLSHRTDLRLLRATDGQEAVECVARERVDLILMDVLMPGLDGNQATRQIKERNDGRYIPVLFVTALDDDEEMARCIDAGGDDFITKPVRRIQLNARVDAWLRVSHVYKTLSDQRDVLDAYQRRTEIDQWIAREVMQRATASELLSFDGLRSCYWPAEILSGDMLLAQQAPDQRCFFLLGDFTGHGIAASIGTVPTADRFHEEVGRGAAAEEVLRAINRNLYDQLPTNLFMAACLLVYDPRDESLGVWNGGMPGLLYREADGDTGHIVSTHLPLGIKPELGAGEVVTIPTPEWIWALSDGALEARDGTGDAFTEERASTVLLERGLAGLETELSAFQEGAQDDITMLEVCTPRLRAALAEQGAPQTMPDWSLTLNLDAPALRKLSPLQPVAAAVAEMQGLDAEARQRIMTVITEMFTNSLEHGVLGLDSGLKSTPEGFCAYYEQREKAIAGLEDGSIRIELELHSQSASACLGIRMTDSGYGFDHERFLAKLSTPDPGTESALSGRGIRLLLNTCESLAYRGRGNRVEARLRLPH